MNQLALSLHRAVRHRKAVEATERASADCPGWSDIAYAFLCEFSRGRTEPFLAEEMIYRSHGHVPEPADPRAWGSLVRKAVREGALRVAGVSSATKNSSLKRTYVGAQ